MMYKNAENKLFQMMVDDLVEYAPNDLELADGIRWLDKEGRKKGMTLYQMVYHALYKHDVNNKAKEWLKSKQSSNTSGKVGEDHG